MYSSGMRVSEVIHLHYDDISRTNMQILIRNTKNRMDRYTILSERNLALLTEYWFQKGRPKGILFPNQFTRTVSYRKYTGTGDPPFCSGCWVIRCHTPLPPSQLCHSRLWSREWNSGIFRHCLDTVIRNPQKFIFMSATNPLWVSAVLLTKRMVQPMDKPTVQDIFHRFYPAYLDQYSPSPVQAKAAHNIMNCKTGAYGANVCICEDCGSVQIHYNSCRNRCCPMCQAVPKEMVDRRTQGGCPGCSLFPSGFYCFPIF